MLQLIIIVVAILVLITGIKACTSSGINVGAGGKKLVGRSAKIAGAIIIAVAVAMIAFSLLGLPLLAGL
jgi:hypothetical protein